jgi:hypothetical protein
MSYEQARWAHLSPARREAHNRLRAARGQPPIPPPTVDLYQPPRPSPSVFVADMTELALEIRAAGAALHERILTGMEGFEIKGGRVEGLEVIEVPGGFEGITEGRKGLVYEDTEGFQVRR